MAVTLNISAKRDGTPRRKCQFQYQSGVDLDIAKRKIKVIETEPYTQIQTIGIIGVLWMDRQNMDMQNRTSCTSHPGHIASSGVPAASPHQVAVGPLMPWGLICVCLWYKAWRVYPAPLLHAYVCGSLHPFLSAFQLRERGIEEIAPVKAQAQLWQLIMMQDAVLHLCMAQLSIQVKALFKISRLSFCGRVTSPVSLLWSCSRDQSKAWNDIVPLKSIECLCS